MSISDSTNLSVWVAAGIQHAVLSRTMPALRHELAGSVSVLRMGLAVLKRRVETAGEMLERDPLQQRIDALDTHIAELGDNLRKLRHWDTPSPEMLAPRQLVGTVWELAHPFLALRSIAQSPLPADDQAWPEDPLSPQPLMYMLLACIYHLAEGTGHGTPDSVTATLESGAIRLSCEGTQTASALAEPPGILNPIRTPPIDRPGLQCLADHLKRRLVFGPGQSLLLHLR